MAVTVGGMLYTTQWTQVILGAFGSGASGSSTISARLFVPAGTPLHASGGETFEPSQVWRAGIARSCANDGDSMIIDITAISFLSVSKFVLAATTEMQMSTIPSMAAHIQRMRRDPVFMI